MRVDNKPKAGSVYSTFKDVLQLIEEYAPRQWKTNAHNQRNHYSMSCPLPWHNDAEHRDHSGSFSVHVDRKVFYCHGCGEGGGSSKLYQLLTGQGEHSPIPQPPKPKATKTKERAPITGITLAQLADAKGLDLNYLRSDLGWKDASWYGTPAVDIPYLGQSDQVLATRYRVDLTGDRFRWQTGSTPQLYGLQKLQWVKESRQVILVEGETDYATLDYAGFPVLAVPGASTWNPNNRWDHYIRGLDVYLWQEPDQGGDTLLGKLLEDNITVRVITPPEGGAKDATELRVQLGDSELFRTTMETLMDGARLEIPERAPRFKRDAHELPEGTMEPRKGGYSRDRDQLVHAGLWMMYMADSSDKERISQETVNAIDGIDRCMVRAAFQRYVGENCRADVAKAVASIPCKGLGHERCNWQHLESSWKRDRGTIVDGQKVSLEKLVNHAYGEAQFNILWLGAATDSYHLFNDYRTLLYKRRPIADDLARTFSAPQATAYGWKVGIMLADTADDVAVAATWQEIAGEKSVIDFQPTDPTATPAEIGLELVCQGKQAVPLLVAQGELTPLEGLDRLDDCYRKAEYHMKDAKQIAQEILANVSASHPSIGNPPNGYIDGSDAPPEHQPGSIPCLCNIPGCRLIPKGKPIHWTKLRGKIRDGQLIEMDDGDLLVSPQLAFTMRGGVMAA